MPTILSTDELDPSVRFGTFRRAICRIADLSAYRSQSDAFNARILGRTLGFMECAFIDSDPVVIARDIKNIARDNNRDYFLALQVSGEGTMRHLGRTIKLGEGDFSLFDSALPYSIEVDVPVKRIVLRFPRDQFLRRGLTSDAVCGRVFSGRRGASGLASRIVQALRSEADDDARVVGQSLAAAILDLLAEAESDDGVRLSTNRSHDQLIQRIRLIALENLSDPDLSVSSIARASGISVRYLHKVFGKTGTTIHKWIEEERLERAYQSLASKQQHHRTIQDIAFSNGFNDSGYFSQRFLKKYGLSPSSVRRG